MIFAGLDIGSQTTCAVIINDKEVIATALRPSGVNPKQIGLATLNLALQKANIPRLEVKYLVATGYGRYQVEANEQISEITCQAQGINWLIPQARTILDIGGQDSKIILLGKNGKVIDFMMNDKCAAGTGRFLELMTQVLDIEIEDYGNMVDQSSEFIELSNTCAIFAETELVSLIAQGKKKEDLARAVCHSVVKRVLTLAGKMSITQPFIFTGGVAKNQGIITILKRELSFSPLIPPDPLITAALGAAYLARRKFLP